VVFSSVPIVGFRLRHVCILSTQAKNRQCGKQGCLGTFE